MQPPYPHSRTDALMQPPYPYSPTQENVEKFLRNGISIGMGLAKNLDKFSDVVLKTHPTC